MWILVTPGFIAEVRNLTDKRWKDHLMNMPIIMNFQWPSDYEVYQLEVTHLNVPANR